jgi:hypothetical protein
VSPIDRVRYYDGEFLRAFDFSDEQTYHMEMRRRLNRYLHLYGIVQGLELVDSIEGGVEQVSIQPGLAIDAFGREIFVFAPYVLGDADIRTNRLIKNTYDVWLRYNKIPTTPPSAGYGLCNQANQYTRWTESFSVVLLQSPSSPFTNPAFTDTDGDDASQDDVGVLLGTVSVDPTSPNAQFASPVFHHRHFWGQIAQRIITPPGYDATQTFNLANKQTPRDPPVSLDIEPNVFAKQNLIVGADFALAANPNTKPVPVPANPGTVKIAGDLLVQGNLYLSISDNNNVPQWPLLKDYVKQLVQQSTPDIQTTTSLKVMVPFTTPGFVSSTVQISVTSNLAKVSSFVAFACVSQWQFDTEDNIKTLGTSQIQLAIFKPVPNPVSGGNFCSAEVPYTVGPATGLGGFSAIASFTLSAIFICFPS